MTERCDHHPINSRLATVEDLASRGQIDFGSEYMRCVCGKWAQTFPVPKGARSMKEPWATLAFVGAAILIPAVVVGVLVLAGIGLWTVLA